MAHKRPETMNDGAPELTDKQRREFLDVVEGLFAAVEDDWGAFDSEEAKRKAWEAHGADLVEEFIEENPGRRPPAWWEFNAPRDRPVFAEDRPADADPSLCNESAYLDVWGELSEEERAKAPGPNPAEWSEMSDEERAKAERLPFWLER